MEVPTWPSRSSPRGGSNTPTDSPAELRKPAMGNAPRIHGELLKLGIDIGETSVGKYMARGHKPPSQTWRTFLDNHVKSIVSIDFLRCRRFASRCCTYCWSWLTTVVEFSIRRHGASDCGMDCAATPGSVSVG